MTGGQILSPQRQAAVRLGAAYRAAFSGPAGRRVLADLLKFCGVARTSVIDAQPIDPHATHFNEGRRRVGLRIVSMMRLAPTEAAAIALDEEKSDE